MLKQNVLHTSRSPLSSHHSFLTHSINFFKEAGGRRQDTMKKALAKQSPPSLFLHRCCSTIQYRGVFLQDRRPSHEWHSLRNNGILCSAFGGPGPFLICGVQLHLPQVVPIKPATWKAKGSMSKKNHIAFIKRLWITLFNACCHKAQRWANWVVRVHQEAGRGGWICTLV